MFDRYANAKVRYEEIVAANNVTHKRAANAKEKVQHYLTKVRQSQEMNLAKNETV